MTEPGEAAETADWAAEVLVTVLVHVPVGGEATSSTVQLWVAGVASTLLAASLARTENWWEPRPKPEKLAGEVQLLQPALSSLHSKLEPDSVEAKAKLAEVAVVLDAGPLLIEVFGAVVSGGVSTVQLRTAGVASTLAAASLALTEKVWEPIVTELKVCGEAQVLQESESSLHWKLEPLSFEEKLKLALVETVVPTGPDSIVVSGGVVSGGACTVQA